MIKAILVVALLVSLCYAYFQRRKSRLVAVGIALTGVAGIYFVLYPSHTSSLAARLGVGRGADLVFYCWIVSSLFIWIDLQFKILTLQVAVTELSRELALRNPRLPDGGESTEGETVRRP